MKILLLALFLLPGLNTQEEYKYTGYETSDTNYYNGEVLYPDMVHDDTLVVTNAGQLNWDMEYYDPVCDADLLDILYASTRPK